MRKMQNGITPEKRARRKRTQAPVTAQDALMMLESAVSYCQSAGLCVQAANSKDGMLGLFIPNAHYIVTDNGTRAAFRLGELPGERDYAGRTLAEPLPA